MAVVEDPLTVSELLLHCVSHRLELFVVLEAQFLLQQVFLLIKLALEPCFFIFQHLRESLLNQIPVVRKFLFSFSSHICMLAAWANHDIFLLLSLEPRWRG